MYARVYSRTRQSTKLLVVLHTINKTEALTLCRDLIEENDKVVLLEDGVYLALQTLPFRAFAINVDVEARGLSHRITKETTKIDYVDFVNLCIEADKTCSWF